MTLTKAIPDVAPNGQDTGQTTHRFVVNADDFGESHDVNMAIVRSHQNGILTTTSLMVGGSGFQDALELAEQNPELRIGLHCTLVQDKSCLPPKDIPDLVNSQGYFPPDPITASKIWLGKPDIGRQIRLELRAQFERFLETDLDLDHVNSHFHFHMHPQFFNAMLELCEEYKLQTHIRIPYESPWLAFRLDSSDVVRKLGYIAKFNLPSVLHKARLRRRGYPVIDGVLGLFQTGHITPKYLVKMLQKAPAGTYELYAHPRLDTVLGQQEMVALTHPSVMDVVHQRNISLTSYSQLPQ